MNTFGPAKILVVDDEPDLEHLIRQRFRHRIKNNEIIFDFASNGEEALKKLQSLPEGYDVVLTDINMPIMDGLTLLENIKKLHHFYKAVVVSAYGDLANIRTAMNRGAFDFITKPIDFGDLEATINKTLTELDLLKQGVLARERLDSAIRDKEHAENSERFKQQFLANMSHEIRTPMNSIVGVTNLLVNSPLSDGQKKYLNVIRKSAENLLVIINDILDLSKIEAGKMEFEQTPFLVSDVLDTAYHTLLFRAEEKKLEFILDIHEDVPKALIGDPVRLTQVLINLSGNALKFTEKGSVTIRVRVKNKTEENADIEFAVMDTGIGIAEDKLGKIFESFSQASSDTTRKYGGTGLGLTISKQLIELQGGGIHVTSTMGQGTSFSFHLVYKIGKVEDVGRAVILDTDASPDELKGLHILLVEDNPFNQMVAVDTLTDLIKDINIDVADNGKIALDMLRAKDYDILLMDVQMPEMDGFEATQQIRTTFDKPKRNTPIMAMTANVTNDEVEKCFESGMDQYISKPFSQQDLLNKIAQLTVRKKQVSA
ncbi:MAG: response regulator [Bacteroidota bacterium]